MSRRKYRPIIYGFKSFQLKKKKEESGYIFNKQNGIHGKLQFTYRIVASSNARYQLGNQLFVKRSGAVHKLSRLIIGNF